MTSSDSPFLACFQRVLQQMRPGWKVRDDQLVGPGGASLRVAQYGHSDSPRHLDVGFRIVPKKGDPFELWDCVTGFGDSDLRVGESAAQIWGATTASALLELQDSGTGDYATHYRGWEPEGFVGWHVIAGNILGLCDSENATHLQRWWVNNPFLHVLSAVLDPDLSDEEAPYGMKILFGAQDVAEVTVQGTRHEEASVALGKLDWPRLDPPAFARSYLIAVHRESSRPEDHGGR